MPDDAPTIHTRLPAQSQIGVLSGANRRRSMLAPLLIPAPA